MSRPAHRHGCRARRLIPAALALACAAFAPLSAAPKDKAAPPADEIVEMEGLTVTAERELPEPEKWHYAAMPGLEVLSKSRGSEARRLSLNFAKFHAALGAVWPEIVRNTPPVVLILGDYKNNILEPFAPEDGNWKELPKTAMFQYGDGRLSFGNHEQLFLIVLDACEEGADEALFRQYLHILSKYNAVQRPPWFMEGYIQNMMKMRKDGMSIVIGQLDKRTEYYFFDIINKITMHYGDEDFNVFFREYPMLDFQKFFGGKSGRMTAKWAKQCQGFVHMCLYARAGKNGRVGKYKTALKDFLARLETEPCTEELFKECFGKTYKEWCKEFRKYCEWPAGMYEPLKITIADDSPLRIAPPEFSAAPEGVSARIKGDALALAGRTRAALDIMRAARVRGDRSVPLLASLGLAAGADGQQARARKLLELAVAGGATRPRAHTGLAAILLRETGGALSPAQLAPVLQRLFAARELTPALPETYRLIAEAWTRSGTPPAPEHLAVLDEGVHRFPGDAGLVCQAAELRARIADYARARALVAHGPKITGAGTPARERLARLQAALPPETAAPAP
ncbi:MAG: hypothetical protein LBC18_15250 [Opitutaceae bacterium]|jgi:hypothetical protein|nr:hypothetical protein [Opitutaceae bacterium]